MITIQTHGGEKNGRYDVLLKPNVDKAAFLLKHKITPIYDLDPINAFIGELDPTTVEALQMSPDVKAIGEDGEIRLF
ncbi:hypothetical protein BD779DRAFT_1680985 [Infundibulicybe gibba]|nr:hypothetical protein BD779DRAFT_1680985 [Infundibulicybe gibba]